jgi:hypothetical protein
MEAILHKENDGYSLSVDGKIFGDTKGHELSSITNKLSLKNCQAIERGYDLDELVNRAFDYMGYHSTVTPHEEKQFKLGYRVAFREALEILGDKKFSEEDIEKAIEFGHKTYHSWKDRNEEKFIQSLQQTEWDVEILEECLDPTCDGLNRKGECITTGKPKLDADGCLILKLKSE